LSYIRGVGQIIGRIFEPGVGINLDDVYLGRSQGAFLDSVNVEEDRSTAWAQVQFCMAATTVVER